MNRVYVSLVGRGWAPTCSHRPRVLLCLPPVLCFVGLMTHPRRHCPSRSSRLGCPRYVRMGRVGCGVSPGGPWLKQTLHRPSCSLVMLRRVAVAAARIRPRAWYVRRWRGEGWVAMGPHRRPCWVLCVPDSPAPRPSGGFPLFLPCLAMPDAHATSPAAAPAPPTVTTAPSWCGVSLAVGGQQAPFIG